MHIARRVGALVLVAAAVAVWFGLAPSDDDAPNHRSDRAAIESSDDGNNALTSGAPQQEVVNGWTTIAYLKLVSEQLDDNAAPEATDERPAAMLGLCVIGIGLLAATTQPAQGAATRVAPQQSAH